MTNIIANCKPGDTFFYHGTCCTVLEQRDDGALCIAPPIKHTFGETANFRNSTLDKYLNGEYMTWLTKNHGHEIQSRFIDLTSASDLACQTRDLKTPSCIRYIAPLSATEYTQCLYLIPDTDVILKEWTTTPYDAWVEGFEQRGTVVVAMNQHGNPWTASCKDEHWVRPAFLLPKTYVVNNDESNELSKYSDEALLTELLRRAKIKEA